MSTDRQPDVPQQPAGDAAVRVSVPRALLARIERKLSETWPYPREEVQALEALLRGGHAVDADRPADVLSSSAAAVGPLAEDVGDRALRDMLTDARTELEQVRDALGVSYEPHQSLHERTLEAARALSTVPGNGAPTSDPLRTTLVGHLMLLVSAGRRGEIDKQRIDAAYRFLNDAGFNRRYRLSADAEAQTTAKRPIAPPVGGADGVRDDIAWRLVRDAFGVSYEPHRSLDERKHDMERGPSSVIGDGIAWRLHANGLYGILSEITGAGVLSRHGDGDLSDRVALAIANHERMAAEAAATQSSSTPAAPAPGNPLLMHIEWLHDSLREAGHCIDGGRCHHACGESGNCFRQDGCVPLTGSGLTDDWRLPVGGDDRRLDVPAQVGNGIFGAGTKWSTVIAAAQRNHVHMQRPEMEALRIAGARPLMESLEANPSVAVLSGDPTVAESTLRELHARARVQGVDHWIENARVALGEDSNMQMNATAMRRLLQTNANVIGLLRQARDELGMVEWENDPPSRVTDLLSEIEAVSRLRPESA